MKLSIIIPVYNAEKYLQKCLQSVCDQNLPKKDCEIIVINDGSADNSKELMQQFAVKYSHIVFIHQENKGVSAARNAGLEIAKGEYITFVDSDDEIEKNSLKQIVEKLEHENLDILYPKIDNYSETGEYLGCMPFLGKYGEIERGFFQERRTFPATFYRKVLLKDISFNPAISFGEDTVFNAKAQILAQRVSYIDYPYYRYTVRENSLSKQGRSEKTFTGFLIAIQDLHIFEMTNFPGESEARRYFDKIYTVFVTRIIELSIVPEWKVKRYEMLVALLSEKNLLYILDGFNEKYPYINRSFYMFKSWQQYLGFKSQVYKLIHRA